MNEAHRCLNGICGPKSWLSKTNIDFDFAINHNLVLRSDLDLGVQSWGCKSFEHDVNFSGFPQEPLHIVLDITYFSENSHESTCNFPLGHWAQTNEISQHSRQRYNTLTGLHGAKIC